MSKAKAARSRTARRPSRLVGLESHPETATATTKAQAANPAGPRTGAPIWKSMAARAPGSTIRWTK